MSKTIIVTGGCGFIGHHFVEHLLRKTDWNIIIIDKLSYASYGLERLRDINALNSQRIKVFTFDLIMPITDGLLLEMGNNINYIVHMAAETHVDNSINNPSLVVNNNILSTLNILEYSRKLENLELFFYFSTDEVYGPALNDKLFKEDDRHKPTNPYSASKSCGEQLCMAYENTYNIPIMRINVMNAFGERQHIEKFIPKTIKNILEGKTVYIHSYPDKKTAGTRFYIHARNIAAALLFLIDKGTIGESYNLTGEKEISNLEIANIIADTLQLPLKYEMIDFHSDRPGHDLRYGLDGNKMKELGWELPVNFDYSIKKTIMWIYNNKKWLNNKF